MMSMSLLHLKNSTRPQGLARPTPGQAHPIRLAHPQCQATRSCDGSVSEASSSQSRRFMLQAAAALAYMPLGWASPEKAAQALPLAPLGPVTRVGDDKRTGMSADEVKDILAVDLADNMYFVTGNLTKEIFADDCKFVDPTNAVTGLSKYVKALGILFDPEWSKVILTDIKVTSPNTIEADWKLGGWLRTQYFPWQPKVEPFSGHTVYTLGPDGLIVKQLQTWSISGADALKETFTPVTGPKTQLF